MREQPNRGRQFEPSMDCTVSLDWHYDVRLLVRMAAISSTFECPPPLAHILQLDRQIQVWNLFIVKNQELALYVKYSDFSLIHELAFSA